MDDLLPAALGTDLPSFTPPDTLDGAAAAITALGHNIHQHAYIIGRTLQWVKAEVGHGNFVAWVDESVWFAPSTARNFMAFARECVGAARQMEYHPGKTPTVGVLAGPAAPPLPPAASDDEPIIPEVVDDDEPGPTTAQEEPMPTSAAPPIPRAAGQEFVEENGVVREVLADLKKIRARLLRVTRRYGLSDTNRADLVAMLTTTLTAVKDA